MPNLNAKILAAYNAGDIEVVLTAEEATIGSGTLHYIKTELSEQFEIIDIRMINVDLVDVAGAFGAGDTYYMDLATMHQGYPIRVREILNQWHRPRIVILDEFSSATPKVQEAMNEVIEFAKTIDGLDLIFVKVR